MALPKNACACVLLTGSLALFAILAGLQTSELAKYWQKGSANGSWNRRLSSASQSATSSVQMAAKRLEATFRFGGSSGGGSEVEGEAMVEDDIAIELKKAEAHEAQWRLQSAEIHLATALHSAESWLRDLAKDTKPRQQRERAVRKAIEVLTRLGSFLVARGRPEKAAEYLRRAEVLAISLAPPSPHATLASPADILARARVHAALGRAVCKGDGKEGKAFLAGKRSLNAAIEAVAEAQAAVSKMEARTFSPLAADVRLDLAQCMLYGEFDLAAARSTVDEAIRVVESDSAGIMSPHLRQRVAMVLGGVEHNEGKFDDALHHYNEYLQAAGSSLSTLPNPNMAAEIFHIMQDIALVMSSKGQIREALVSIDDILRLQQAADAELQAKSLRRTPGYEQLSASDTIDPRLWAGTARTHSIQAEMLLEEGRAAHKPTALIALNNAQTAVTMLKTTGRPNTADLEDALNTLGNVLLSLGKIAMAEAPYRESLNLAEKRHGTFSPVVAVLYHNVGVAQSMRGAFDLAENNYQRALDIQLKTLGFGNPDTASSLTAIADIFEKQGKLGEAADAAARAAESTRINYPEGHWERTEADERAAKYAAAWRPTSKFVASVLEGL